VPRAAIVLTFCAATAPLRARYDPSSHLRIEIAGHHFEVRPGRNNSRLPIKAREASSETLHAKAASGGSPNLSWEESDRRWTVFPTILHSGRAGAGRLRLKIEDSARLKPLREAQKHKSLVASAGLGYHYRNSGACIGKHRCKGIRVLSLENVPPRSCPEYALTIRFPSVEKI
jgi:hypothetical protein